MKPTFSPITNLLVVNLITICLLAFSLTSCVRQTRSVQVVSDQGSLRGSVSTQPLVNINSAPRDELERLPGVGPALATRIIEHRERFGRFRRVEHLIMVRGFSDRKFRVLRPFAVVE